MRSLLSLPVVALLLAGCAGPLAAPGPVSPPIITPPAPQLDTTTRAAAVSIVNREMAMRLPGQNVVPYTRCVVDNATMAELSELAAMGANSSSAAPAVAAIVKRPETTQCIAGLSRTA